MPKLREIFTNKYIITGITFAIWMLFFDRNDFSIQFNRVQELHKLKESEKLMTDQIADTKLELVLLKTNPETLEKYAREKFMMKKDNEDIFKVTFDSSLIK